MKTYIKYPILFALAFSLSNTACSQRLTVSAGVDVGTPVVYSYYYYPDYEIYYRLETGTWFIRRNFMWVTYSYLPTEYYFIRSGGCRRVILPYHGSKHPFAYHSKFKSSYPKNSKMVKSKNKNKIDYNMNTSWKSQKPTPMKTNISNKSKSGGGNKSGSGGNKGHGGKGKHKK